MDLMIGERPRRQDEALEEQLFRLNNELAVFARENARKSKVLERAKADLERALGALSAEVAERKRAQADLAKLLAREQAARTDA